MKSAIFISFGFLSCIVKNTGKMCWMGEFSFNMSEILQEVKLSKFAKASKHVKKCML